MTDIRIDIDTKANPGALTDVSAALSRVQDALGKTKDAAERTALNTTYLTQKLRQLADFGFRAAKDFAIESVAAYLENEQAMRRLRSVAGDLTEGLAAQADAMQEQLGVSGEAIMGMQELALRYGVQRGQLDGLIRATLDYAAATGNDARSALQRLLVGVDNGGAGLARMGIQYKTTGDYGKDLELVVKSLGERFGGTAKTQAETLTGQAHALALAWGEVKESFGGWLLQVAKGIGLTDALRETIFALNALLGIGEAGAYRESIKRRERLNELETERLDLLDKIKAQTKATESFGLNPLYDPVIQQSHARVAQLDEELDRLRQVSAAARLAQQPMLGPQAPGGSRETAKAAKEAAEAREKRHKEEQESWEKSQSDIAEAIAQGEKQFAGLKEEGTQLQLRLVQEELDKEKKEKQKAIDWEREAAEQWEREKADARERENERALAAFERQQELAKAAQERLHNAAIASGQLALSTTLDIIRGQRQAEVSHQNQMRALNEQYARDMEEAKQYVGAKSEELGRTALVRLQAGMKAAVKTKEFDPLAVIKIAIPAIVTIAMSSYGPTQPYAALVGQAVALLMELHEGGWVGDAPPARKEVPAMLLTGERVLSHREVSAMGGPRAVDEYASGARPSGSTQVNLTVVTLDSSSFRRYLEGDGGRGMARSIIGGRGEAAQLLRRMTRTEG